MATEAIYTKSLGGAEDLLLDASNSPTVIQTRAGKELEITKINSSTIPYSGKFGDPAMVSIKDQLDSSAYVIDTVDDFGTVPSGIDTVIVKDNNRGGTFIYDATQSAINNGGTVFDGWVRQYNGAVNVKWFGAKGDGVTDDTNTTKQALSIAVSLLKELFIPRGTYILNSIELSSYSKIKGEGKGNTILKNNIDGGSVFLNPVLSGYITDIYIGHLTMTSSALNSMAYKHTTNEAYTSRCLFEDIDTYLDFEVSYSGMFIYTRWIRCIDGYNGNIKSGQTHAGIIAKPETYGQTNQNNLNLIDQCEFFGSNNTNGAIVWEYGATLLITNTDFENVSTRALYIRGVSNVSVYACWFEDVDRSDIIYCAQSPAPNVQRTTININSSTLIATPSNQYFVHVAGLVLVSVNSVDFSKIPVGFELINNYIRLLESYGLSVLSGDSSFVSLVKPKRNIELSSSSISSPNMQNINVLPIGPNGLGSINFTSSGFSIKDAVASVIGLGDAIRVRLIDSHNYMYYTLPSKLIDFIKGKTITLVFTGYGGGSGVQGIDASVWENSIPNYTNRISGTPVTGVASTALQTGYITHTISDTAESFSVGIYAGGNANGAYFYIESMQLLLGEVSPLISIK